MNITATEKIIFKDSKSAIAFGFECTARGRFKADDIFSLDARYVVYSKTMDGESIKDIYTLSFHSCKHEDFYNLYNESFDYLSLSSYYCLDDNNQVIEGIWNDKVFTYYEFGVVSKNGTLENLDNIEEYLFQNDCKFQFFYTDITIDLYDYENPIAPYLNAFFIQLNPALFIKRNIYFMNQYLKDDGYMLGLMTNYNKNVQIKTLFSRYEEYSLYVGLNKSITQPYYAHDLAKVYVRADIRKTDIRRNYQKLMEFYANATSLLLGVFRGLVIIFNFINGFYAEDSLIKKIFFLKEFDDKNHFNIFKKGKQIKDLIYLTNQASSENSEANSFETNLKDLFIKNTIFQNPDAKSYNNHKKNYIEMKRNIGRNTFSFSKNKIDSEIGTIKSSNTKINSIISSKCEKEEMKNNNNKGIKIKDSSIKKIIIEDNTMNGNKYQEYYFNIFEVIISSFCKCCMSKRLTLKRNIKNKGIDILYNKLDIVTYIRNMILIDIINETLLGTYKKDIINFLSRPLLTINKDGQKEFSQFYQDYTENDFNKFFDGISELMQKAEKNEREKNLIFLVNKNLKEFI